MISDNFESEFGVELWGHRKGGLVERQPVKTEDLKNYALIGSTNKIFDNWLDLQIVTLKRLGLTLPIHVRELNTLNEFALTLQPDEIMIAPAETKDPSKDINPDHVRLEWDFCNSQNPYCLFYAEGPKAAIAQELAGICRELACKE